MSTPRGVARGLASSPPQGQAACTFHFSARPSILVRPAKLHRGLPAGHGIDGWLLDCLDSAFIFGRFYGICVLEGMGIKHGENQARKSHGDNGHRSLSLIRTKMAQELDLCASFGRFEGSHKRYSKRMEKSFKENAVGRYFGNMACHDVNDICPLAPRHWILA